MRHFGGAVAVISRLVRRRRAAFGDLSPRPAKDLAPHGQFSYTALVYTAATSHEMHI
ncbi:MAG: hypothetical protein AAF307_11480 [Pseudomonadota bacterium]